jgi:DNA (cytosine-5)-methyltransferase 1
MFPEAVRAVRELRPQAFIFENVKGLTRRAFASYFEYVRLQLTHPDLRRRRMENWEDHRVRLERHHTARGTHATYNVVTRVLNAADFGVPQRRERVFLVGIRADLRIEWAFPRGSHSEDALLIDQWVTGVYWDRHEVPRRRRPAMNHRHSLRVRRLREIRLFESSPPWLTVRDVLSDLPDPERQRRADVPNHDFNPGARSYPGHTGSPLDEPAKTLKAGDHGVPGGENMLARPDGTVRYFTVREAARLQTFPDSYRFSGAWSEAMRQLGNAVPVRLAEGISRSLHATLSTAVAHGSTA